MATRAGARVYREAQDGKGNVVRRMFADVDADIYVLAEGDGSADPADAPSLVNALITEHVDMVVGTRRGARSAPGGSFGSRASTGSTAASLATTSTDILSGYRAFTRRFVKSFPAISTGFDVEIELSMHASQLKIPVAEIELSGGSHAERGPAGASDRRTSRMPENARRLLMKETRPFAFYAVFAVVFWIARAFAITCRSCSAHPAGAVEPPFSDAALGMSMFVAGFILAGMRADPRRARPLAGRAEAHPLPDRAGARGQ